MAKVILVGRDVALLEGLAQTLLGFGHVVSFAGTVREAAGTYVSEPQALAVVSTEALEEAGTGVSLPLAAGGALIVYSSSHDERITLPPSLQRVTLANLVLPLERHRLLALVQSFESRSRATGRGIQEPDLGETELRG